MDGAIPGLVALDAVRKQAEEAVRSKLVSSTTSWPLHELIPSGLSSCLGFPPWAMIYNM